MAYQEFTETKNPMQYDWWLQGPGGAGFCLYRKPEHTDEDVKEAKAYLRHNRDVVSLKVERI